MIGKLFGNRYEVKEKLGAGGMSIVYKGLDTLLNRMVTIKVLREQYASDEDFVRRFRREAQSVASLSHINIVSIFDVGFEGDLHYLVMEFVEGQNLKEYIKQKGKLPVSEAVPLAMQILDALEHAHEHGVVHRDIKPHNILLTKNGRIKVTDFGIARAASETTVTYTGTIVGSVHYISPEQAKGITIGSKSDIYSAGVVLYEMLTGQLPFTGDSPIAIALQHIQNEPQSPSALVKEIPEELSQVVLTAMEKDPESRYQTAREMRYDLEKIYFGRANEINLIKSQRGESEDTVEIPAVGGVENYHRRRRKLKPKSKWGLIGAAVLLFLLVIWAGYSGLINFLNVEETTVPDVEGKSLVEAKAQLEEAGLKYSIAARTNHPTIEKDHVITQSLTAGDTVKKNRIVDLTVSEGPKQTTVPDVVGSVRRDAEVDISNHNLKSSSAEEFSPDVPLDHVISQDPEGGEEVAEGTTVSLVISKGPEPVYLSMPNLLGQTLDDAKKTLTDNGLKSGKVDQKESDEYFAWQVISQSVEKETQIQQGSTVDLVVSTGPGPSPQTFHVVYADIPDDGEQHRVQILVADKKDTRYEYDQMHQAGDLVDQYVQVYGTGKVEIFLDGKSVYSKDVP
ncbi:Stk1 family PASTA domain-containing Ser/Thr kinase [Candidatus Formimonas warabiya]|uniref:non-specific serine/threonine protein kinase n=1 Tax=Formimonas warabiya TaxID=1761012 RepID=A0A3G1KQE2_FORW1|nr:Stk1 family PASTA domain-containing Ser/Thr kinase [Candidatus Formimonas warabiya]ATW24692.1 hypothetical protein DCMF_07800 [Candidatus Formimonas warabiya]